MMKVFWALLVCFLSVINNALADSTRVSQQMSFGTIRVQDVASQAIVVVGTDDSYGTLTNIATSSSPKSGVVDYTATNIFISKRVTAGTVSGELTCSASTCSSCKISFDSMTVSPTSQSFLGFFSSQTKSFDYGGKITIPANCGYGDFSGSLAVNYTSGGSNSGSATLPVTLTLEPQPVSVQSTQDLSFGTLLATATHDVVVNPNGTRQSSLYVVNDASYPYHNGIIQITKQESGSRSVTVAVDSQTSISNGGTSLSVDLVTSPVASSITTLTSKDTYINVGGTLHVTQGAPAGEYNGTYRIEVTY